MKEIILKASSAETDSTTQDGVAIINDDAENKFTEVLVEFDVTALATETGDTLDVYVDVSFDNENWINAIHFTQVVGDGSASTEIAKLTNEALNDPDAVLAVTSDASAGVVRNLGVWPYMRSRSSITDATTDNASFTYSVKAYAR